MNTSTDTYHTLAGPSEGEFKDRGSKFLAYAYPVLDADEAAARLMEVKKAHPKARHHCYAYRLGLDRYNFRANDDGEPSGTAGKPILGQIDSTGLTNTLVVVVRYFGGTLLGASGLIQAYKASTADALAHATVAERWVENEYLLRFEYSLMSQVMNVVSAPPFRVVGQQFDAAAEVRVALVRSQAAAALKTLKAQVANVYLEEVDDLGDIEGFEILPI